MTLYDAWSHLKSSDHDRYTNARDAVARGEQIFDSFPIAIRGVRGVNDALGQDVVQGTCTFCHDAPNVGNHSTSLPLDLGLSDESRRTPDMPLYTFRNKTAGEVIRSTDPGRALITGKWKHINVFKGPILRGLAAHGPYFHNGSAATLLDVGNFYDATFELNLTDDQKSDLVAFLRSL